MNDLLIVPKIENRPSAISPEAEAKKNELLTRSALVLQVTNPTELQIAVNQSQEIQRLLNEADGSIEFHYRPFKSICDWISSKGKEYKLRLLEEKARLKKLMDHFAAQEQERVEAEQRKIDEDRMKAEREAAAAIAEQERLANLAKPSPKKEIAAEIKVQAAVENLRKVETTVAPQAAKAAGYGAKKVVKWEITDAAALYAVRPEWFELVPKKSVMNNSIKMATNLPGLKVWGTIETKTRS